MRTENKTPSKKRKRRISQDASNYRDAKTLRTLSAENPAAAAAAAEEAEEGKEEHTESDIKIINNNIAEVEIPWRRSTSWKNLDFVLSLQGKQLSTQKKIELAYDFVNSARDNKPWSIDGNRFESVSMSRLVPFLNDWIQSILISVDKKAHAADGEEFDPCLDFRAWNVFKFCLKESSSSQLSFSPNMLRAVSHVIRHGISGSGESLNLFEIVSECFSLMFSLHGRSINATVDSWVSAANASLDLALKIFADDRCANNVGDVLLGLSCSVLQPFANYLRIHPSPKNTFPVVVGRLLEQLLAVLVSSSRPVNGSHCDLLNVVEDISSNGLFHHAHIEGFLSGTNVKEPKAQIKSYHKRLFRRLEQFATEKKLSALGGLGHLLSLFVRKAKKQKRAPDTRVKSEIAAAKQNSVSENSLSVVSPDEEMCKSLFDIFVQFMEPLIIGIKSYSKIEWSEVGDCSLTFISEAHLILKSINKMLASFMHEKIYSRTKDTSEGAHFNFLKEVYDMIISFTTQIRVLWQSAPVKENEGCAEMLLLVAKEVIVSVSHFVEIEYKVIRDELFGLWLLMISFMAVDLSIAETHHLTSEILSLGCQLVNLYSDLRQVDEPIFALCRAVRFLGFPANDGGSRFASCMPCYLPKACVKSLVTLLSSQEFRHAVSAAVKSIPEGQASGCIRELKMDVIKSLEWMKSSNLEAIGEELEQTKVPNSSVLDFSSQAELLGKGLSEIYTLILDSSTVTTGNSVPVGNSMRDLMTAIQPTLGCLVQNQSDTLDEFLLVVTGRRFSSHMIDEYRSSTYWFLAFFFRVYISCRSLYRQLLSLMPPDSSRKASVAMGDLFTAFSGKDWLARADWTDGGYFSWIIKPSIPLMAIVQSISSMFLQNKCAAEAPLVFVLHTMAFQRLVDLNRQIKAFEFVQEKDARLGQTKLMEDAALHTSHSASKKLEMHISVLKQEATDLTNFLTGYLPLMVKKKQFASLSVEGDVTGVGQDMLVVDEFNTWDFAVCSLDESSLPTAIWWLLCQNTDVWCPHATKKCVKKFLSLLFNHLLSSISGFKIIREQKLEEPGRQMKVTPCCISLELLTDASLYEQTFLCRHLTSKFCHILKKSLSSLFRRSLSSDVSFGSIPDWSEVLAKLEAQGIGLNDNYDGSMMEPDSVPRNLRHKKSHKRGKDFPLNFMELVTCQSLLNLLCWIPKGYESSRSLSIYLTYILNIESLVVPSLLEHKGQLFLHNHYELLKLFVSCRRALRYLLVASDEEYLEARQSSLVPVLFENSFSLVWLLKSVSEVVVISPALHQKDRSRQVKDMMFSLMDHTFHIFTILSESHVKAALQALTNEQSPIKELHIFNGGHEGCSVTEADLPSDTTEQFRFLADETRNLLSTLKETVQNANLEAVTSVINWNKLTSFLSCCQGYLWGIASALNSADEARVQSQKRRFFHVLKCLRMDVFEDFINYCLNILLVDDSTQPVSLCASDHHPELDCIDRELGSKKSFRAAVETDEVENSTRDEQEAELMDGKDDYMASGSCDENKNESNNGTNIRSSKKSTLANGTVNALTEADKINSFELKYLNKSLLQSLLKGERPEVAFAMRQLFVASSAILRLKYLFSSRRFSKAQISCPSTSTVILIGTSHFLLSEFGEMVGRPDPFSFVWLEGIIKFLEVLGDYFPSADPVLTRSVYTKLIGIHLMAIGKCISLQGKSATLASHETESRTKTLQGQQAFSYNGVPSLCHEQCNLNEFKSRLRMSFKMFIRKALELHLLSAVQALERALVGVQVGCHVIYEITAGNADGGRVSPVVAAGIDCLDLILESVSGGRRSNVIKRHIQSLISALFNIVLHLQSPLIFFQANLSNDKGHIDPDPGSVVLMCVEVLTKVAGKHSLLQMDPTHVGQSLHIPSTLFKHLCQLKALPSTYRSLTFTAREGDRHLDCQFSVELFAACCKLLCTVLRHRKSESERCIALLEDSVTTLLYCLEMVDAGFSSKNDYLVWEVHEGITCASFLRRIYEEIRQQKDVLGRYSFHFLSNYIWIFSGYGPRKTGIRREIDEALRPGVYALIDACSPDDLQQLHIVLGEGPCRSTLATLQHDYKLNFQYQGKV